MDQLNYHHLRYFWMVAREGSLRAAAETLHLSQPTISAQIAALEDHLGEKLFLRTGRRLVLSDAGRRAFEVAEAIFQLGGDLQNRVRGKSGERTLRLNVGIADSVPKIFSWEAISPVFKLDEPVHVSVREGDTSDLLGRLVAGRLDVILSDEPAPSSLAVKAYSHLLRESRTIFCSTVTLARKLTKNFPDSLENFPVVMPLTSTAWRHALEGWFNRRHVRPKLVAEFEDAALMKLAGAAGLGVIPLPETIFEAVREQYHFAKIGTADDCIIRYYSITAQRKITHPAVAAILKNAPIPKSRKNLQ
jgi:LysR family transcriptional regulator, transcriptional activator of nhaA